jgi:glycerophosphoryl diester phosphodiesterase
MNAAGSEVFVTGPYTSGDPGTSGVDTADIAAQLPSDFTGGIWTNRIDVIAPRFGRAGCRRGTSNVCEIR